MSEHDNRFDDADFDDNVPVEGEYEESVTEEAVRYAPPELTGASPDEPESVDSSPDEMQSTQPERPTRRSRPVDFEELTLSQALEQFLRAPSQTWQALRDVMESSPRRTSQIPIPEQGQLPSPPVLDIDWDDNVVEDDVNDSEDNKEKRKGLPFSLRSFLAHPRPHVQSVFYLLAFFLAFVGTLILVNAPVRIETEGLVSGIPWMIMGFFVWVLAELYRYGPQLVDWWRSKDSLARLQFYVRLIPMTLIINGLVIYIRSFDMPSEDVLGVVQRGSESIMLGLVIWLLLVLSRRLLSRMYNRNSSQFPEWVQIAFGNRDQLHDTGPYNGPIDYRSHSLSFYVTRGGIAVIAVIFSLLTWLGTTGNLFGTVNFVVFEVSVFWCWMLSIVLWILVFVPHGWSPFRVIGGWQRSIGQFNWRAHRGTILALVVIMSLGAVFRLSNLGAVPPEMTSDHVEKLLDSSRVLNGTHQIFFANNGGREPFQMYAMALFSQLPGRGIDFTSLKLLAVLESLITLPVLFWMGYELIGERNRKLGILTGLMLAGLVAVSYWHVAITRLSLRIVLTPLVTALLLIFLSRGLRHNRRMDFIKAGLVLGFGLYTYQAVRMLPVVILVGVAIALLAAKSWRIRWRFIWNLSVLVLISFVIFIPLFHFSVESPEEFWRRTSGRLLGDDVITEENESGQIIRRFPTLAERIEAFNENVPGLMRNIRNALLMFNWKGDVAWINGAPNEPTMDPFTGAL